MDRFANLVEELADALNTDLYIDGNDLCALMIDERIPLQLEMDERKERLLITAIVAEVPPGSYRETLFQECLIHNDHPPPRLGIFSYLERNNQLILFEFLQIKELTGEDLATYLNAFIPKVTEWKEAIERGAPLPSLPNEPRVNQ